MERNSEVYQTYVEILKRELGRVAMHETNTEIIHMMIHDRDR